MAAIATDVRLVVLVVEDEPLIRMAAADFFEEDGFAVIEAANADEAIKVLETNPAVRIVFTDIEMPGSMDGIKLAAAIRRRWPPVELIITSGKRVPKSAELPERALFFPKPYQDAHILGAARAFL